MKMKVKTCHVKNHLLGEIRGNDRTFPCEPNGGSLYIYGNHKDIIKIHGVFSANKTDTSNKFKCNVDGGLYQGEIWGVDSYNQDESQIFRYNSEIITFQEKK